MNFVYAMTPSVFLGVLLLTVLGLLIVYLLGRTQDAVAPAVTAYAIQIILGFGFFLIVGLVADDAFYHLAASEFSMALRNGESLDAQIGVTKASFIWLLGGLYFIVGSHPLIGIVFNATLMGLVPSLISSSCRRFGMGEVARTAAWIAALAPQLIFWSPWLRREALAFFLLTLVVLAMALLFSRRYLPGAFLLLVVTIALSVTRAQLVAVALAGAIASIVASSNRVSRGILITVPVGLLAAVIWVLRIAPEPIYTAVAAPLDVARLDGILSETSADTQNLRVEGVSKAFNTSIVGFGVNLTRTVAGPFPWEWKNLAWVVTGLDGIVFLLLFVTSIWVLRVCPDRRRQVMILWVALVPLIVGTALLLGNYGIVMRIRAHFLPFLIPILALGLRQFASMRSRSRYTSHT